MGRDGGTEVLAPLSGEETGPLVLQTGLRQGRRAQLGRRRVRARRDSAGGLSNLGLKINFKRNIWNIWQQVP